MRFDSVEIKGKIWVQVHAESGLNYRHRGMDDEGRIFYSTSDKKLWLGTSTEWLELSGKYAVVNTGTRMLMGYQPLPDNWNLNTNSVINGKIILLTNEEDSIGDYNSGSWTITGIQTADSHDHGGTLTSSSYLSIGNSDWKGDYIPLYTHIHSLLDDGVHTHSFDGTWRPAHVKFGEAEYS